MVAASLMWSLGGVFVKAADCSPVALTGVRCITAALVFGLLCGKARRPTSAVQVGAGAAFFLMAAAFAAATRLTTAANAVVLQFTAPIFVAALSALCLGEKPTARELAASAAVGVGIFFCFAGDVAEGALLGDAVALLSGFCYAVFILLSRRQKDAEPAGSLFIGNLLGAFFCLPWVLTAQMSTADVGIGILFGLLTGSLGFIFFAKAIRHISALAAVLFASLDPVLNPVWVMLFLGETPPAESFIGTAVIVVSLFVKSLADLRGEERLSRKNKAAGN